MTEKEWDRKRDERLTVYTSVGTGIGTAAGSGFILLLGPVAPAVGAVAGGLFGLAAGLIRNRSGR